MLTGEPRCPFAELLKAFDVLQVTYASFQMSAKVFSFCHFAGIGICFASHGEQSCQQLGSLPAVHLPCDLYVAIFG